MTPRSRRQRSRVGEPRRWPPSPPTRRSRLASARGWARIVNVIVEPKSTPEGRFLLAFEMAEFGIALMRANLRRRFPDASDAEVATRLAAWIEGPDPSDQDMKCIAWPR